jgi:hypothetical protein
MFRRFCESRKLLDHLQLSVVEGRSHTIGLIRGRV